MAKDKEVEKAYHAEKLRRTKIRKAKRRSYRNEVYKNKYIIGRCEYDQNKECNGCMDC